MNLKCMVEENRCQSRGNLLEDIKRGSRLLEQQLSRFVDWIGDRKIVSFTEMQQTRKLQKVCVIRFVYPAMVPAVLNLYVDKPFAQLIQRRHSTKQTKGKK